MADTKHAPATPPVEADGISYRGIVWFIVILTGTTLFCQALVWGLFDVMAWRARTTDAARATLSAPAASPTIENGRLVSGTDGPPAPGLLVTESTVLHDFRKSEDEILTTYGWMDKSSQIVRIPVDRAKELILERGLPARAAGAAAAPATPVKAAAPKAAAAATPKGGK
jgi:hypothetical protein